MPMTLQIALKRVGLAVSVGIFSCSAIASTRDRATPEADVKQAFARLALVKSYRIETSGTLDGAPIDSRIDAQFPDHFHILNRGPNGSELVLTPEGSFAKTDANATWRAVPMSFLNMAESIGPTANETLLKSMRNVAFKGAAKCRGSNASAKQYVFETDSSSNPKAPMRTTITIANLSGLPCSIRAQQPSTRIDTTAHYDYTSKFSIEVPK